MSERGVRVCRLLFSRDHIGGDGVLMVGGVVWMLERNVHFLIPALG